MNTVINIRERQPRAARIILVLLGIYGVLSTGLVVFIPGYFALALLLKWFDFKPVEVLLLYGVYGTLAEVLSFGAQNLGSVGFWVFVYGLMVWLPTCSIPQERGQRPLRWWHWPLALMMIFCAGVPFGPLVLAFRKLFPGL